MLLAHELSLKELELKAAALTQRGDTSPFDVGRHIKLVPPFSEKDVERFFSF